MKTILIQLDTDSLPSSFDRVVAVDAGVDEIFSYCGITPQNVTGLIHGAIFTRGPSDLKNTAVFVGGSDVTAGEALVRKISSIFFGPMRVSVMMDSNGCNTTAAAAIAVARNRMSLSGCTATVLGATGPVGIRAAQLLASEKAKVRVVSRTMDRAIAVCRTIEQSSGNQCTEPTVAATAEEFESVCRGSDLVVAAGAAGVSFLPEGTLSQLSGLKMAIDLNAVPPAGIAEIGVMDRGTDKNGVLCYGALGVGGLKMKVHKQSVRKLFESSQQVIDLTEIYQLALAIDNG
jgi:hypothetical protein